VLPPRGSLDSMREWLWEALQPLPELESRAMFGGTGIYSAGTMFATLHAGRVYRKTCEAFIQRGSAPFEPREDTVLASYHEVPGEILDDGAELLAWAQRALGWQGPRSRSAAPALPFPPKTSWRPASVSPRRRCTAGFKPRSRFFPSGAVCVANDLCACHELQVELTAQNAPLSIPAGRSRTCDSAAVIG
jgi:DNA transformation protein